MAITKNSERQYPLVGSVTFDHSNLAASDTISVEVPAGATVIGGGLNITTAFNGTSVIDVNDGTNDYIVDDNGAAGWNTLSALGTVYAANDSIDVTLQSGSPTAGVATLYIEYVMADRSNENFG
jgi:hypothetical protein